MNIVFSDTDVADGSEEDDPVFCEFPIGPGRQFSRAEEVHNYTEELLKISGQNLSFQSQRSWTCLKADVKSPAVVVNAK